MQPELNPYTPGSGLRPPTLLGRDQQIAYMDQLIIRAKRGMIDRGMVLSGLRGVGKTVLLQELRTMCERHGWFTVPIEGQLTATGQLSVRERLARQFGTGLRRHAIKTRLEKVAKSLERVVGNFAVSVGGVEVSRSPLDPATSGVLEVDLQETVVEIAEALKPHGQALGIFVDEMQDLDGELLAALLTAQHYAQQSQLPFFIIGAGLPNLPATLAASRSYAERLFYYQLVGPLPSETTQRALAEPASKLGATFTGQPLITLADASGGYPYFIQEYGRAIWDIAQAKIFTEADAEAAVQLGQAHLDSGFYPSRWERTTPAEREYLAAMARLADDGREQVPTSMIAEHLTTAPTSLSNVRAQVITKGLVFPPERGQLAFTVPGMAGFITRQRL